MPFWSGSRRAPDLSATDMPWSPLGVAASVTQSSDSSLFFPDPKPYFDSHAPPKRQSREDHEDCDKPVLPSRLNSIQESWDPREGTPSSGSVDPPRGDNPVGPPEEHIVPVQNKGRRHSLSPEQRRHAALMRAVRNCWHCVFQKYLVSTQSI